MSERRIDCFGRQDMNPSETVAAMVTHGVLTASLVKSTVRSDSLEPLDMVQEFERLGQQVVDGDLRQIEKALTRQFMALDALFGELGDRGMRSQDLRVKEALLKLALRAQSQARSTAETLGALKNPPFVIAQQANFAAGPQLVSNTATPPRASNKKKAPTELFGDQLNAPPLDTRTARKASRSHQDLGAVESKYGSDNGWRKSEVENEPLSRRPTRKVTRARTAGPECDS